MQRTSAARQVTTRECCSGAALAADLPGVGLRRARAFSRRELLALLARGAGAAVAAPSLLELLCRHSLAQETSGRAPAKRLLLIWLEGGPSQIDTFDPKPGARTNGPFKALPTDVKGWTMSEHLPGLARRAERLAVVRTMTSKEGSHTRARELLHCGYPPNPSVTFPSLGSIVAHEVGDLDFDLPAFVQVGGIPSGSGYLGVQSAPFVLRDPTRKIENFDYGRGDGKELMDHREEMRAALEAEFARRGGARAVDVNEIQRKRARRLMETKLARAFDLEEEPGATRRAYGPETFGQGVLLARRLLEHGVTAVEVILDGWDTHIDNFNRTRQLCAQLDPALSALLDDLKSRGLHDETLVVCMGEFGRTPTITPAAGRNHWPNNYCVLLAGGGMKGGTVVGETDEQGEKIVSRPVQVPDLFATIAQTLHLERDKVFQASTTRPVKLIDPNGAVVSELLA